MTISSVTASFRFDGASNVVSSWRRSVIVAEIGYREQISLEELAHFLFEPEIKWLLVKYHPTWPIYDILIPKDINAFDWCPTGFKVSIRCQTHTLVPGDFAKVQGSVLMTSNTAAIA
eukprot:163285_1